MIGKPKCLEGSIKAPISKVNLNGIEKMTVIENNEKTIDDKCVGRGVTDTTILFGAILPESDGLIKLIASMI